LFSRVTALLIFSNRRMPRQRDDAERDLVQSPFVIDSSPAHGDHHDALEKKPHASAQCAKGVYSIYRGSRLNFGSSKEKTHLPLTMSRHIRPSFSRPVAVTTPKSYPKT